MCIQSISCSYEIILKNRIKFSINVGLNHYSYNYIPDIISKVYNFEQSTKAGNQGEYYFYNSLGEDFVFDNVDRIYTGVKIDDEKKISDFQRIRGFQNMENAYDQIMTMGEEMTYVEITTD